ncbi:MAG: peptidoglycan DD-metalloendopeptidase family protein [Campylobacterota bacterium]|nr:peptidoglycan DD-metalloendopeptidase family protein [Campylobacterota bacterium]
MKPLFIFIALHLLLFSSVKDIENKIDNNKKRYNNELKNKKDLDKQIKYLANLINKEELRYKNIVQILDNTNTTLMLNRLKLNRAKESLIKLQKSSANLETSKKQIEDDVINFVIEKYSMSMGIKQANKETLQELVDKEVYSLVLDNAKQEVLDLNIDYLKVNRKRRKNIDKTTQLSTFIDEQEQKYKEYLKMSDDQKKVIGSLEKKHKEYQQHLEKIIKKQNKITDLLGSLNILKKQEIDKQRAKERKAKAKAKKAKALKAKKEKERLAKERKAKKRLEAKKIKISKKPKQQEVKTISREALDEDIDIEVRKLGSSTKGIKISKYRGSKTIAPLKSYTITKKFGKYYDEVYKMELFNESVSLKTKKANAKVLSVFKGQIVYAKQNSGLLENVVIVKHKNNLHTIYSHLDKISPTLSVGKWIPKGYVVGRVNDTLLFQATKDSKYIDPEKLFK